MQDDRSLRHKVEMIARSTDRLQRALTLARDDYAWAFLRKESWLHLRRSLELWWMVIRRRE